MARPPARRASGDRTWQSILDGLTVRAKRDGLLGSVVLAKTFEDKMRRVTDSIVVRGKLSSWISECAESHYSKSGGTASKLRDEGNFKVGNIHYPCLPAKCLCNDFLNSFDATSTRED